MGTLKSLPPAVDSAEELLAMAYAMEEEAARRYRGLAARMRLRREDRLATLFDFFADIESKHAVQIGARSIALGGRSVETSRVGWDVPENFDEEAGGSLLLTPYRALAIAVRNEERAFAFYSYIAGAAQDRRTRELAEGLAKDELDHAWLLRRERRKAYRAELSSGQLHPVAALPGSLTELQVTIAETEWCAAQYHHRVAESLQGSDTEAADLFTKVAIDEEARARTAAVSGQHELAPPIADVSPTSDGGLRLLEEAFERYMDIAARSRDETVMREAQQQAERVLAHLGLVRLARGDSKSRSYA